MGPQFLSFTAFEEVITNLCISTNFLCFFAHNVRPLKKNIIGHKTNLKK